MSGRIVVTGPDGTVAEDGDQQRRYATPRRAGWNRHLTWDKWHATAEDLVDLLIGLLPPAP
jgi:hypothetical protein